jgi:nucleotide-binding universal stress UspA family protein
MPYERIVVAVDFSQDSLAALGSVKELARRLGSELILLHVSEALKVVPGSGLAEDERQAWQAELDAEVKRLADEGLRARGIVRGGFPVADEILAVAAEERADLLVIGTLGRTGLKERLLGTIADEVMRRAPCPVLVVRHADAAPPR